MPLPTFASATPDRRAARLNRTQAAARLGLAGLTFDKLMRGGVLSLPISSLHVDELASRAYLRVETGELTVLRTDARAKAETTYPMAESGRWVGFHVDHDNSELDETSLRWWRCDVDRVLENQLFAVTIATVPVAVYQILRHTRTVALPGESAPRHAFGGRLLTRMYRDLEIRESDDGPSELLLLARHIMNSRIRVDSGGPIGYLMSEPQSR